MRLSCTVSIAAGLGLGPSNALIKACGTQGLLHAGEKVNGLCTFIIVTSPCCLAFLTRPCPIARIRSFGNSVWSRSVAQQSSQGYVHAMFNIDSHPTWVQGARVVCTYM